MTKLAWGAKVSPEFRSRVDSICAKIKIADPSWLMACMAFETGHTFSPSVRNGAGSGAVGLIQFMPSTAAAFGTTTAHLATLSAVDQLGYVEKYFAPWCARLHSLGDVYGAIIWPGMIGKAENWPVFTKADPHHPKLYIQNQGLDFNRDGDITKAEIVARVQKELLAGLQPGNVYAEAMV
jgi:hypothetical protein